MCAELALHVRVAQQPHRLGEVVAVRAEDAAEEGKRREEGEGLGAEGGGGEDGRWVGEEAERGFHCGELWLRRCGVRDGVKAPGFRGGRDDLIGGNWPRLPTLG